MPTRSATLQLVVAALELELVVAALERPMTDRRQPVDAADPVQSG